MRTRLSRFFVCPAEQSTGFLLPVGVSERLAVLIEGESLLNDAAAIVVFIVFRDAMVGDGDSSPLSVLETAARMSLGGTYVYVFLLI